MVKEIKISDLEYNEKPILTIKEYETIHFVGEKLQILDEDKELEQFLSNKK